MITATITTKFFLFFKRSYAISQSLSGILIGAEPGDTGSWAEDFFDD